MPDLDYERASVMLVPIREQVPVSMEPTPKSPGLPLAPQNGPLYVLIGAGIAFLTALVGLALLALFPHDALRRHKETASASEDQSPQRWYGRTGMHISLFSDTIMRKPVLFRTMLVFNGRLNSAVPDCPEV